MVCERGIWIEALLAFVFSTSELFIVEMRYWQMVRC